MKIKLLTILLSFYLAANAQSVWKDKYYDSLNVKNYSNFKPFNEIIDIKNFDFRLAGAAVFYKTNEIRLKRKLSYIQYNKNLESAAYFHSLNMAEKSFFDHINKKDNKRKTPSDRAGMSGVVNPYIAENIVEGFVLDYIANKPTYLRGEGKFSYSTDGKLLPPLTYLQLAENLLKAWMNSPKHKDNIVSKNNLELGCGVALYFDKDFNSMPMVKATQVFQQYENVKTKKAVDRIDGI